MQAAETLCTYLNGTDFKYRTDQRNAPEIHRHTWSNWQSEEIMIDTVETRSRNSSVLWDKYPDSWLQWSLKTTGEDRKVLNDKIQVLNVSK